MAGLAVVELVVQVLQLRGQKAQSSSTCCMRLAMPVA
jgi:hypothetical protein